MQQHMLCITYRQQKYKNLQKSGKYQSQTVVIIGEVGT